MKKLLNFILGVILAIRIMFGNYFYKYFTTYKRNEKIVGTSKVNHLNYAMPSLAFSRFIIFFITVALVHGEDILGIYEETSTSFHVLISVGVGYLLAPFVVMFFIPKEYRLKCFFGYYVPVPITLTWLIMK